MDTVTQVDLSGLSKDFPPVVMPVKVGKGLTIPEEVIAQFPGIDAFEVRIQGQRIVLEPMCNGKFARVPESMPTLEEIQRAVAARDVTEQDVADAVKWARSRRR